MLQPQKTWNAAGGKIEQVIGDSSFILLLSQSQGTYLHVYTSCTFIVHLFECIGVGRTMQTLLEQQSGETPCCTSATMCLPFIRSIWSFSQVLDWSLRLCWEKRLSPDICQILKYDLLFWPLCNIPLRAETCGFHLDWIKSLVSGYLGYFQQKECSALTWGPWHTSVIETPYKNGAREAGFYLGYSVLFAKINGSRISWPGGSTSFINNYQWTSSNKVA